MNFSGTFCDLCQQNLSSPYHLKRHFNTVHEKIKNHTCESCDQSFARAEHLRRHQKTVHDNLRDQNCAFCGKSFSRYEHLKRHIIRVHANSEETPLPKWEIPLAEEVAPLKSERTEIPPVVFPQDLN